MEPDQASLPKISELARDYNVIPVFRELVADMETPVSVFAKIGRDRQNAFLLESVEGGERVARYSFIGIDPFLRFRAKGGHYRISGLREEDGDGHPVVRLQSLVNEFKSYHPDSLPPFSCGAVGYFSYDTIRLYEEIPSKNPDDTGMDDIDFGFYQTLIAFDNCSHKLILITHILVSVPGSLESKLQAANSELDILEKSLRQPMPITTRKDVEFNQNDLRSDFPAGDYMKGVDRIKEYIRAGDAFQVVLSQRLRAPCPADPFDIYRCLRIVNPSPYMYFLKLENTYVVGASPEMLVRVENGIVETRPIAGTRPRGSTPEEDARLADELMADEKERAEHIMLVDLGRNDLGRVSVHGSVSPKELMVVERYSHVMHIVSSVHGRLRPDLNALDALFACFPAGTLSGAPKIRAMEIIDELEPTRRGIYGGALGYIDFAGNLDTCIVIRTLVVRDGEAIIQVGAGIVADSVPQKENEECLNKGRALFKATEMAVKRQKEL